MKNKTVNYRLPENDATQSTDQLVNEKYSTVAASVKKEMKEIRKQFHFFIVDWQIHEAKSSE